MRHIFIPAVTCITLCGAGFTAVHGQNIEPEWRVVNTEPARVVPSVENSPNPFPTAQVVEVVSASAVLDEGALEHMSLLVKLESQIKQGNIFVPAVNRIRFYGYMDGPRGGTVLYSGRWAKVGDTVPVDVQISAGIIENIAQVTAYSAEDGARLQSTVQNLKKDHAMLRITALDAQKATLNSGNQKYIVYINRR
jgi:hypothetical protein